MNIIETIVVALCVAGVLLGSVFMIAEYNSNKNARENVTIQQCLDKGNSPLECRFAVKGRVN